MNLSIWIGWVQALIRRPFEQIDKVELTAAFIIVCVISPAALSLGWFYLRTKLLHHRLGVDHPTPRGWEHFVRNHSEFWVLFHLKTGKLLGGYFGAKSYAATYPQEPEIYVEEIWRVDENGEFVEVVAGTLGGVIRISECDRVEFLQVKQEVTTNGPEGVVQEGAAGAGPPADRPAPAGGSTGPGPGPGASHTAEGRVGHGSPEGNGQVTTC